MKNAKKILILLLCAILLVGASVAGTMAYLTSNDTVRNTFTIGNVTIKLEEYAVDAQTGEKGTAVVEGLTNIELVPGRTIEKNPFITVDPDSETCYLFVKVENELTGAGEIVWNADWEHIEGAYYKYTGGTNGIVNPGAVVDVFTSFTCSKTLDSTSLAAFDGKTIVVTAYAIQSESFADVDAAWEGLNLT